MKKLKILVADSQVVVKQHLLQELKKDQQMEVIGTAGNGKEAYEIFEREEPNIIIFDLLLPIYDGYTLLDKMNEHGVSNEQKLIMTTPITSDLLVSEAFHQGVDYVLTKPYDATIVADKIRTIYERMNRPITAGVVEKDRDTGRIRVSGTAHKYGMKESDETYYELDKIISKRLNEIGIPARLKGYRYMITAIKRIVENDEALESVTKILYPDVAKKHNSTAQRVEKAIRHAIEVAWSAEGDYPAHKEFQYIISPGKSRPTNSEFIAKLAQDIKLTYNKNMMTCK